MRNSVSIAALAVLVVSATSTGQPLPTGKISGTIPVVFSGAGADGSFFLSQTRLYNPSSQPISGTLVITPSGPPIRIRTLPYSMGPYEVQSVDLTAWFATIDIVPTTGASPVATVLVSNSLGSTGSFGFSETDVPPTEAISAGQRALLLGPADPSNFRFNIGFSASSTHGANVTVTIRQGDGSLVGSVPLTLGGFDQLTAPQIIGTPLQPNMTFTFDITLGSAIIYGVTADNRTNDTSFQLAHRIGGLP